MKIKSIFLVLLSLPGLVFGNWILPVPDGGGVKPSEQSIQGTIVKIENNIIKIKPDNPNNKKSLGRDFQYNNQTKLFFYEGGILFPHELSAGQYIWIWYITENQEKAGNPPMAAVIMLWSTSLKDKPSNEIKKRFAK